MGAASIENKQEITMTFINGNLGAMKALRKNLGIEKCS